MPGKQDGPGPNIYGPPRAPRIVKNAHLCILWPIYEKLAVILFPCYTYVCSVMSFTPTYAVVHNICHAYKSDSDSKPT